MNSRLVGVIHLPPLAGSPRAELAPQECARLAAADARVLVETGFDMAIVENFGDTPFFAGRVPEITVAAMTACAVAIRDAAPGLPLGVNVLRNDASAALAIAIATGAAFIRVNVLTGARVTDQGVVEGDAASLFRARRALGGSAVDIWADVDVKHSAPLAARPLADEVSDVVSRSMAGAVLATRTGTRPRAEHRSPPCRPSRAAATASSSGARCDPTAWRAGRSIACVRRSSPARSVPPSARALPERGPRAREKTRARERGELGLDRRLTRAADHIAKTRRSTPRR